MGVLWALGRGFVLFSLLSSSVYLLNDVIDVEKDRQHPTKRNRPIASGELSPRPGGGGRASLLMPAAWSRATCSARRSRGRGGYLVMQIAYIFALKKVVLLDVFVIAIGFVMRAVSGAVVIGAEISPWLYTVTLLGALFLGLCKRRNELVLLDANAGEHRKILQKYTPVAARQPDQHRGVVDDHGVLALHVHVAQAAAATT